LVLAVRRAWSARTTRPLGAGVPRYHLACRRRPRRFRHLSRRPLVSRLWRAGPARF